MTWREYLKKFEPPPKPKTNGDKSEQVTEYSYEDFSDYSDSYESPHSLQNSGSRL